MKLEKLPKRKVTVDELIRTDDFTDFLKNIHEHRSEVDQVVVIYTDDGAIPHFWWHGTKERLLWILEQAKFKLLNGDFDEEEE